MDKKIKVNSILYKILLKFKDEFNKDANYIINDAVRALNDEALILQEEELIRKFKILYAMYMTLNKNKIPNTIPDDMEISLDIEIKDYDKIVELIKKSTGVKTIHNKFLLAIILLNKLMYNFEKRKTDSDEEAWKYYETIYKENKNNDDPINWKPINEYVEADIDEKGYEVRYIKRYKYISNSCKNNEYDYTSEIELAGDRLFNFGEEKEKCFNNIINYCDNKELKIIAKDKLRKCVQNNLSNANFALMPRTGGMNIVKGKIYYSDEKKKYNILASNQYNILCHDRLDTFIYYLYSFYEMKNKGDKFSLLEAGVFYNNSVLRYALQTNNFIELYNFLVQFKDIYHYCRVFYHIYDEKFVDRMRESGKKPIRKINELIEYMNLADDFWKIQISYYEKRKL